MRILKGEEQESSIWAESRVANEIDYDPRPFGSKNSGQVQVHKSVLMSEAADSFSEFGNEFIKEVKAREPSQVLETKLLKALRKYIRKEISAAIAGSDVVGQRGTS